MNICTKYGFDILIISGNYGGHDTRRMTDAGRRTTPRVWHKLPTGGLKICCLSNFISDIPHNSFLDPKSKIDVNVKMVTSLELIIVCRTSY